MGLLDKERLNKLRQKQETTFVPIFFHRPLAILMLIPTADIPWVTPNRLTTLNILMRLVAAALIWPQALGGMADTTASLWACAILWNVGGAVDAMDGALARYRGCGSNFGRFYDKVSDRLVTLVMMMAVSARAFYATDDVLYVLLAMAYVAVMSATSVAKWIELGTQPGGDKAQDPHEHSAPERGVGDWIAYVVRKLPTALFVSEMDLPLWGAIAVLGGWEHHLILYLTATSVPYGLFAIARRALRVYRDVAPTAGD